MKQGDLLTTKAIIIGHQVNTRGAMNSGVARQIRQKYPLAYERYKQYCNYETDLLGLVQYVPQADGHIIANMFAQKDYGYDGKQYTALNALHNCLMDLKGYAKGLQCSIALPYKVGCCRGGADWETQVYPMIKEIFDDEDSNLELWRLDCG